VTFTNARAVRPSRPVRPSRSGVLHCPPGAGLRCAPARPPAGRWAARRTRSRDRDAAGCVDDDQLLFPSMRSCLRGGARAPRRPAGGACRRPRKGGARTPAAPRLRAAWRTRVRVSTMEDSLHWSEHYCGRDHIVRSPPT